MQESCLTLNRDKCVIQYQVTGHALHMVIHKSDCWIENIKVVPRMRGPADRI